MKAKIKIVSVVLVVLLMGLTLSGCTSTEELDECRALVAEQAAQIEDLEAQIEDLKVQIVDLNSTIEQKDARIVELEQELETPQKERAKIEIIFTPDPVPCENERWYWRVVIAEAKGIGVELKSLISYVYRGERALDVRMKWDTSRFEEVFGTSYLPPKGSMNFGAGFPCQDVTHEIVVVTGIDDNGNPVTATGRVDFVR